MTLIASPVSTLNQQITRTVLTLYQPDCAPQKFPINQPILSIGRGDDQDIQIDDNGISRTHLQILCKDNDLFVRDCGSRNGTWLDNERLIDDHEYHWRQSETVQIGLTMLMFSREVAATLVLKDRPRQQMSQSQDETVVESADHINALSLEAWRTGQNITLTITNNRAFPQKCNVSVDGESWVKISGICWEIEVAAGDTVWLPFEYNIVRSRWRRRRIEQVRFVVSAESGGWGSADLSLS